MVVQNDARLQERHTTDVAQPAERAKIELAH
jgi:hypothetical protein